MTAGPRAALTSWLLGPHVQMSGGQHAGAAAGWIDSAGNASYVYPEITGYYLQWLAWQASHHGANDELRRRATMAQQWLRWWASSSKHPETRVYLQPAPPDWRNSALFFFDLSMVMRGLASADLVGLVEVDPSLVARLSELLVSLLANDRNFDACAPASADTELPIRWSTRRGPFLSKAASGVLLASAQFSAVPRALARAADATFAASLDAMSTQSHDDVHALLYGIEGALMLPDHRATVAAMPRIVDDLRELLRHFSESGKIPESTSDSGRLRLDIVAQTIRATALALPEALDQADARQMTRMLVDHVHPELGIPFSPSEHPAQYNAWTAMFAEQALFAAERDSHGPLTDLRRFLV